MAIPKEVQESPHWDRWATALSDNYNFNMQRNNYVAPERTVDLALPHLVQRETVLDLGAGAGLVGKLLAKQGFQVDGVDFSEGMLSKIPPRIYRELMQLDLRAKDLGDVINVRYRNLISVGVYGDYLEPEHLKNALQLAEDQATVAVAGYNDRMDGLKEILEGQSFRIKENRVEFAHNQFSRWVITKSIALSIPNFLGGKRKVNYHYLVAVRE